MDVLKLSDTIDRKFTDIVDLDGWEIETDEGFSPISKIMKTIEYDEYSLILDDGKELLCADDHIVFNEDMEEVFVKNLKKGDLIQTKDGPKKVFFISETGIKKEMYDVTVDDENHRYYTNGILSHNTTSSAGFLLWQAMFKSDCTILLVANKLSSALEVMNRIRFAYENMEEHNWLRCGVTEYNKSSIVFDNGSSIIARATTPDAARGLSISCVSTETTFVNVMDHDGNITNKPIMEIVDGGYKVETNEGYKDFSDYLISEKDILRVEFRDHTLDCTRDHKLFSLERNCWVEVDLLNIGEEILTSDGSDIITSKDFLKFGEVIDLVNVFDTNSYFTNGVLSHNCLYVDEFAFVKQNMASEFWSAIQPTLATGGSCIVTSTPNSDEDEFAKIWKLAINDTDDQGHTLPNGEGRNGFYPLKFTWQDHPERDEEWAYKERMKIGEAKFGREYECMFYSENDTLIDSLVLSGLTPQNEKFIIDDSRWFSEPKANHVYGICWDVAMGSLADFSTIQVIDYTDMEQVAEWKSNKVPVKTQLAMLVKILYYIHQTLSEDEYQEGEPEIFWSFENNGLGAAADSEISAFGEENIPGILINDRSKGQRVKGLRTSQNNKLAACSLLKRLLESDRLKIHSRPLIRELKGFIRSGGSYKAKQGEHDDLVMALVLSMRLMTLVKDWSDNIDQEAMESGFEDNLVIEPMPIIT